MRDSLIDQTKFLVVLEFMELRESSSALILNFKESLLTWLL